MSTTTKARVADFPAIERSTKSHRIADFITDDHNLGDLHIDRFARDGGGSHWSARFGLVPGQDVPEVTAHVFADADAVALSFKLPHQQVDAWVSHREAVRLAHEILRRVGAAEA